MARSKICVSLGVFSATLCLISCDAEPRKTLANIQRPINTSPQKREKWKIETLKDSITDDVSKTMMIDDKSLTGHLMFLCDKNIDAVVISSDLYLDSDSFKDVTYRVDGEKATSADMHLSAKTASLATPFRNSLFKRLKGDLAINAINEFEFVVETTLKPHTRLQVRLQSINGERRDLDFDIIGLDTAFKTFSKSCPPVISK